MSLRLGGICYARNALYLILFLTGGMVAAQEVSNNFRAQTLVIKPPAERCVGKPGTPVSQDAVVSTRLEKEGAREESDGNNIRRSKPDAEAGHSVAASDLSASANAKPTPQSGATDKWQFQFTPYIWAASLHGDAGIGNRTTSVDESFADVFRALDLVPFMGVLEVRRRNFMLLTDVEYVSLADGKATPGPLFSSVNAKFKMFIFDPEVGYRVFGDLNKGSFVDVLGGVRVWHLKTDLTFSPGILAGTEVQGSRTWVDGVIGLRGKAALSEKWFITGKFDLGGGGSKFTYHLFGAVGYDVSKKFALILGYRDLNVRYDKDGFLYDMSQRGPILGFGFKF